MDVLISSHLRYPEIKLLLYEYKNKIFEVPYVNIEKLRQLGIMMNTTVNKTVKNGELL